MPLKYRKMIVFQSQVGFSLMEVLVAMGIMSIVTLGLSQMYSNLSQSSTYHAAKKNAESEANLMLQTMRVNLYQVLESVDTTQGGPPKFHTYNVENPKFRADAEEDENRIAFYNVGWRFQTNNNSVNQDILFISNVCAQSQESISRYLPEMTNEYLYSVMNQKRSKRSAREKHELFNNQNPDPNLQSCALQMELLDCPKNTTISVTLNSTLGVSGFNYQIPRYLSRKSNIYEHPVAAMTCLYNYGDSDYRVAYLWTAILKSKGLSTKNNEKNLRWFSRRMTIVPATTSNSSYMRRQK